MTGYGIRVAIGEVLAILLMRYFLGFEKIF